MPKRSSCSSSSSSCSGSSSSSSRSPTPESRVLRVTNLTGNVNRNHLYEIFENYGIIKSVDLAEKQGKEGKLKRGYAYVEMSHRADAGNAKKAMDGGWIDGNIIGVTFYQTSKRERRYDRRSRSPHRRRRRRNVSKYSSGSRN